MPPSIPFDGRLVLDSDEILAMDQPFGSIVIVGAGAVVTKDVGAHQLVVGNPARQIREVPPEELL